MPAWKASLGRKLCVSPLACRIHPRSPLLGLVCLSYQRLEIGFGDDGDSKFFGFVPLGAAAFPGEDVTGLGGNGTADLAAFGLDESFEFVPIGAEGAGDDEGFSREGK